MKEKEILNAKNNNDTKNKDKNEETKYYNHCLCVLKSALNLIGKNGWSV